MIRGLLKWTGLLLLCVGIVWLGVIGYWFVTHADPSARDLVLYLVALPLAAFVLFVAVRAAGRALRSSDDDDDTEADTTVAASTPSQEDRRCLLAGAALRLPAGDDGAAVLATLHDGTTRPGLDDNLVDDAGLPVFACRVAALDDEACSAETLDLPDPARDETAPLDWPLYQRRAIALLDQSLEELAEVTLVPLIEPIEAQSDSTASTARDADEAAQPTIHGVRVFIVPPADPAWSETTLQSLARRYRQQLQARVGDACPPITVEYLDPTQPVPAMAALDGWLGRLAHGDRQEIAVVLALHSDIDPERIGTLDRAGRLFSQANPDGRIPSEGGVALLVAPETLQPCFDTAELIIAHRAILGARDREIGSGGRENGKRLVQLVGEAIATAGRPASDTGCFLSDSGIGAARGVEIGAVFNNDAFEHLDSGADHLGLGSCCGDLDGVATVATLALARQQSLDETHVVVVLSTRDALQRAAQVLGPPIDETASDETSNNQPAASSDA
ncbi:hypothetical protein [Salinisphaera sp. Q1T1-3]|uniref:hypothetical protein n=1 Tax=Salinisphaera sp. Q1T1-3 TaxID=2321229 RepID=UPI000E76D207|nr:hypothetical protein [Salinisphaera sp. Q1T1-3]RJS91682.1 hypothetical protein D3260_14630 [Salinisphaera sp. Q1T1-3]